MDGEVKVAINYDRIADDSKWDGLKGYLTNTDIPIQDVYTAYHNLWHVERAFRIAKSKIEIRPMFHFTRKRIEAHICICFVALKVYKELERMLKVSEIKMSVDKVLALAKTITTIQIKLPLNKEVYTQTMLMARHQKIAKLFDEDFWVTRGRSQAVPQPRFRHHSSCCRSRIFLLCLCLSCFFRLPYFIDLQTVSIVS